MSRQVDATLPSLRYWKATDNPGGGLPATVLYGHYYDGVHHISDTPPAMNDVPGVNLPAIRIDADNKPTQTSK